jgi:hypothetical protein
MPHLRCGDAGAIKDDEGRAYCFVCGKPLDGGPDDGSMSRALATLRAYTIQLLASRSTSHIDGQGPCRS